MSNSTSASKSVEKSRVVSQPLRVQELLGLPKSTGKKKMQPVLMKDILGPVEWEKARQSVYDQRRTMKPDTLNNARRKLYEDAENPKTPGNCDDKTKADVHVSGLSKSEGKVNNQGLERTRMQPVNMKRLMESWEKVQTARQSSRMTKIEVRNQKVRRQLYSHLPSPPKPVAKNNPIARKSEMKPRKSLIVDVRTASTSYVSSRKSRLVPPNSIRDKYVRQQDTIEEDSTLSSKNESIKKKDTESEETGDETVENSENANIDKSDKLPDSLTLENIPNDRQTRDETIHNEIVRPSVIMGISAKKLQKEQSPKSNDNVKTKNSKVNGFLKEPKRKKSLRGEILDGTDQSPSDNLGDTSHCYNNESFCLNLPQNSFLKSTLSTKNSLMFLDKETVLWMHANLKLQVQSTEEQLFSMKRLLKTFEDLIKDQDKEGIQGTESAIPSEDIPAGKIKNFESEAVEENVTNEKAGELPCEIPTLEESTKIVAIEVVPLSPSNRDLSREPESSPIRQNIDDQDKENEISVEKPRRRSARLAVKMLQSPRLSNDSFSSIEKELNIVHAKAKKETPVKRKSGSKVDPRCRRSVREYMALKSSTNFLATPDVKGVKAAIEEKCTPSIVRSNRRDLSRRVLNQMEDLYADSPM